MCSAFGAVLSRKAYAVAHAAGEFPDPGTTSYQRVLGGILIPATAQVAKRLIWAEVLAIGNHVRSVEVGDLVLFSPDDQAEVEISGDDYMLLRERDIHAVAAERVESNTGLYL